MSAGILTQISLVKESAWGTAGVPTKSLPIDPTGGFEIKNNQKYLSAIKAQIAKNYDSIIGKRSYEGAYTFDAFADLLGYFLLSCLGNDTASLHSGETTVYDHLFTEATTKPSLTIEESTSENCRRYNGAITSSLKVEVKTGEPVKVTATQMAKGQTSSTAITPVYSTVPPFNFAQASVKIGGSTIGEVESVELEYKNNVEFVYAVGSNDPQYYAAKLSEVTGKIEMYLDSTTLTRLTNYLANTKESIELIITGNSIGTAANYALDILIPKASYKTADTKITEGHNLLTIEFEGIYDTATSKLLSVTLTNLITSY